MCFSILCLARFRPRTRPRRQHDGCGKGGGSHRRGPRPKTRQGDATSPLAQIRRMTAYRMDVSAWRYLTAGEDTRAMAADLSAPVTMSPRSRSPTEASKIYMIEDRSYSVNCATFACGKAAMYIRGDILNSSVASSTCLTQLQAPSPQAHRLLANFEAPPDLNLAPFQLHYGQEHRERSACRHAPRVPFTPSLQGVE